MNDDVKKTKATRASAGKAKKSPAIAKSGSKPAPVAKKKSVLGRPVTGTAKSSTQRGKAADDALLQSGGRILSRTRLSREANNALQALAPAHGSDRSAIEKALISAAKSA